MKIAIPILVLLVAGVSQANACSCHFQPPLETLALSDAVFSGTLVDTTETPGRIKGNFVLIDCWKGTLPDTVCVDTSNSSAACGVFFEPGFDYLIYASGTGDTLSTSSCQRSRFLDDAQGDVAELGPPKSTPVLPVSWGRIRAWYER